MLPEILNSKDGGVEVLNKLGVDKSFIDSAFNKFGAYGAKVGLNKGDIKSTIDNLERAMDKSRPTEIDAPKNKPASYNPSKYPKL